MNGFACNACTFVFPFEDAGTEFVSSLQNGGPATHYHCPECMSRDIQECSVCPECQSERCVEGEDMGKHCLAAEQDALSDLAAQVLGEQRREERRRQERRALMINIMAPPRPRPPSMLEEVERLRRRASV